MQQQQLALLLAGSSHAQPTIVGGGRGFDNPRIIRAVCLLFILFGLAERARVADSLSLSLSRGGSVSVCLQRPPRERNAALLRPSITERRAALGWMRRREEYARRALSLSPLSPSLSLVSVKVFQSPTAARARVLSLRALERTDLENNNDGRSRTSRNVNDPSAGSPTETLLRLLLPLNDQVWSSSRQHRQCRRIAAHQSEDLTKSFNR